MCNIIGLPPKQVLPWNSFKNMVMNNRDGYGLVVLNDGKMEVIKEMPEKGNDPEVLARLVERFKDHQKFLHVRYNTVGETNRENTHPFTVYKGHDNHQVEFMHNGTMSDFKPSYNSEDKRSDTRVFAETFLSPLLSRWQGDQGLADIEDPFMKVLLEKYFNYTNRGLLISNKMNALFLGKWSTVKSEEGVDLPSSNTDYFHSIISTRDKFKPTIIQQGGSNPNPTQALATTNASAVKEETSGDNKVVQLREAKSNTTDEVTKLADLPSVIRTPGRFITPNEIANLVDLGGDELDHESILYFSSILPLELATFFTSETEAATALFFFVVEAYAILNGAMEEALDDANTAMQKHERATNAIAVMAAQLKAAQDKASVAAVEAEKWKALYLASQPTTTTAGDPLEGVLEASEESVEASRAA